MSRRTEKVGDQLQTEIADLLMRNVKHPALTDVMLSITKVELTPDFRRARISVSLLAEDGKAGFDEVLEALERTEPYFHRELMKRLTLRRVPRLTFIADHSIEEGDRLATLLRELKTSGPEA
jgi:ribosome-binding factor A